MPDYNAAASRYWWLVVLSGAGVLAWALWTVAMMAPLVILQVLAGVALTMLAGVFPVRIPRTKHSFAAGEIFMFLLLLLHGPAAAILAAAAEGATGSFRTSKRWTSRLGSPAIASLAMVLSGVAFEGLLGVLKAHGLTNDGLQIVAAMVFAVLYFVSNTLMVTELLRLKRGERFKLRDLLDVFGWIAAATAGSAAVASLLFLTYRQSGIGVLMAIVPVIAMLLATLHYFFRQQEANEVVREAAALAAEREVASQARHLRELEVSERRFHSAFTHASIGMALMTFDGHILQSNTALLELLGREGEDLTRSGIRRFVADSDMPALAEQLVRLKLGEIEDLALEMRCLHRNGSVLWIAAHGSLFSEPGADAPCLILQAHDITARRRAEEDLQHIAFHDSLTGLPNRRRFHEHLSAAVVAARGHNKQNYAVMFLDFDRFKLINDSLGHNAGDEFLIQVSRRLQEHLRPQDIVARLGGDEFAVLARELEDHGSVTQLADRLLLALQLPFIVFGTELNTSASIGITCSEFGYETTEDVLRDADIAMYKAKAAGKARYAIFDGSMHAQASRRLRLEGDLRQALAKGTLAVAYQPLFNLATGKLVGFEALARWTHPEFGAVAPDVFIPIAEETGMILALTDLVLGRACQQLKHWQSRDHSLLELTLHVNVSGRDLAHAGFVGRVSQALLVASILPRCLTLELTENILMTQLESALPKLKQLRTLGVGLSVDDFGTGYSSLSHLSSLPIDSLKVDRSFVSDLRSGTNESMVVRAVVQLGNALGKSVVAEGIETAAQMVHLREMGCTLGQGFHLSRPLTPEAVDDLIDTLLAQPHAVSGLNLVRSTGMTLAVAAKAAQSEFASLPMPLH